jgi:Abnormal spindle-like microcephaly-assoc'd, ASPM-SPD-2-Hydin
MAVTFSNPGTSPITINGLDKNAPWYFYPRGLPLPRQVLPGQSVTFNVVYSPTSNRSSSGTFTYHTSASNSVALSLSGTGVASGTLSANPLSLGFGWIPIGASSTKTLTVTNPSNSVLTVTQISGSGGPQSNPFATSGVSTPLSLAAGQSFTFQVTFTPQSTGDAFGNLSVVSSTGGQITVAENGFGWAGGILNVKPASLNFGNVTVGSSQSQTLTLSSTSGPLTISSDSLGSSEYTISGLTLPLTIPAGQSVPVAVTFSPQASGSANTNLAFVAGSGVSNPVLTALSGTGVAPTQHSVALSWAPSSSDVAGYNVYRGSKSAGPYAKINSSIESSTDYADDSVNAGNSYYYEVTSVDASGMESVPSPPVAASVPSP